MSLAPTATNMKFKFPAFIPLDDASIEFALEEARVVCGEIGDGNWIDDANQTLGTMYYAAHLLQVSLMRAQSGSGLVVASESTPELSITYRDPGMPKINEVIDLTMTEYGVRFMGLVRSNFPAVLTVNSAVKM